MYGHKDDTTSLLGALIGAGLRRAEVDWAENGHVHENGHDHAHDHEHEHENDE